MSKWMLLKHVQTYKYSMGQIQVWVCQQSEMKIQKRLIFFMKLMLIFTCTPKLCLIQKSISPKTSLQIDISL